MARPSGASQLEPPEGRSISPSSGDPGSGPGCTSTSRAWDPDATVERAVRLGAQLRCARTTAGARCFHPVACRSACSKPPVTSLRRRRPGRTGTPVAWCRCASTPPSPRTSRRSPSGGPCWAGGGWTHARPSSPASGTTTLGHPSSCSSSASASRVDRCGPSLDHGDRRRVQRGTTGAGPRRRRHRSRTRRLACPPRSQRRRRSVSRGTRPRTSFVETSAEADAISGPARGS